MQNATLLAAIAAKKGTVAEFLLSIGASSNILNEVPQLICRGVCVGLFFIYLGFNLSGL